MVTEIALIVIDPTRWEEFERAVSEAAKLFREAPGCMGMMLEREIEDPSRYRLDLSWKTVEAHTEDFRSSQAFKQWSSLIGPFIVEPPVAVHCRQIARYF